MDDSCAVCADALEWVAYGACGHKEVCSTCVARLRFICNDRRCCICKTESNVVFVTKALGDYTRMINDFSVLPTEVKEGRVGSYWYHEDTQAYFDDLDHYKMIKAMCRLSCSVCDKMEEQPNEGSRRRGRFRNIGQLKGHLFRQHRLLMCSLCLKGRKVFVCEQKLYKRAQLNQHISTGDAEVDGTESERGGFTGHPLCEFCRSPFYGENELYLHMSTEHYTCHICQRQHPGQYDYYKNYDDLEIHFRREHFLCEDEACLAKKFVVFQTEAEMKRHNTLQHGGHMSRSKRNAALQIPTSFRFRQRNEQDNRHGRGRTFHRDYSDDTALFMAIQASSESANTDGRFHDASSSNAQVVPDHVERSDIDIITRPFESLATIDSEPSSRYLQALSQNSRNRMLEDSSFPPLPMAPANSQQKARHDFEGLPKNSMASHLRRQNKNKVTVLNSGQTWPVASSGPVPSASRSVYVRPTVNFASGSSSSSSSFLEERPKFVDEPSFAGSSSSSKSLLRKDRISHLSSAPNLVESGSFETSVSDFPPVSAAQTRNSSHAMLNSEDVHTANKLLVEKIRTALEFNEDKYSAFKDISAEYQQGLMDAEIYLAYVEQFGLSHLVRELARLCPHTQKQKELVETYNANLVTGGLKENGWSNGSTHLKDSNDSKKGKGRPLNVENTNSKDNLADGILSTVRKLQSNCKSLQEEVEVLSKDEYRAAKDKSKVVVDEQQEELSWADQTIKLKGQNNSESSGGGSNQSLGDGIGKGKQRKKTSKFHRVRLGDGSVAALLDFKNSNPDPDPDPVKCSDLLPSSSDTNKNTIEGLPIRGVWQNGGCQKLFGDDSRRP